MQARRSSSWFGIAAGVAGLALAGALVAVTVWPTRGSEENAGIVSHDQPIIDERTVRVSTAGPAQLSGTGRT